MQVTTDGVAASPPTLDLPYLMARSAHETPFPFVVRHALSRVYDE